MELSPGLTESKVLVKERNWAQNEVAEGECGEGRGRFYAGWREAVAEKGWNLNPQLSGRAVLRQAHTRVTNANSKASYMPAGPGPQPGHQ